jgi:hypothetical protein
VASLREALKGSDIEAIRGGMTALAETLQRVSTAAYQAAASGAGDAEGEEGPTNGYEKAEGPDAAGTTPEGEEAVEGEFKEV